MPETKDRPDHFDVDYPDLPPGWSWASGNVSGGYYTRWFETDYRMGGPLAGKHGLGGYSGEVYWDRGGEHHVAIYPIESIDDHDDPNYGYSVAYDTFETAQDAMDAVPGLIRGLSG